MTVSSWFSQLFCNGAGRIGRIAFVAASLVLLAAFAGFQGHAPAGLQRWAGWVVDLLLVFCACAVTGKRLHDRGRSGWWTALALLAFVNVWPAPQGLGWLFAAVLAAMLFELAGLPGQPRFNRYGPRPVAPWALGQPLARPAG